MKAIKPFIAAALAVTATGAFAETGANLTQVDNVTYVYGRANVPHVQLAGPVVTRPAIAVVAGPDTEEGPIAVAIGSKDSDVNKVAGRT